MDNEDRLKILLSDIDKEFLGLNYYQRAKLAIEQISMWQQRFNDSKGKIETFIDATPASGAIGQYPEIEA